MKKEQFDKTHFENAYQELNERQKEAVDCIEGPVLVVAGPGTGKTQILAIRIGKILQETDTLPENILCLTYTDAGSIEMRKRLVTFIGTAAYRVGIYTFHAFCHEVIRTHQDYFGTRTLEPVSELEQVTMVENILLHLPPNNILKKFYDDQSYETGRLLRLFDTMKKENWMPATILDAIELYIKDLPTRDEYIYKTNNKARGFSKGDLKTAAIEQEVKRMEQLQAGVALYDVYQKEMQKAGRYDFNDMIQWVKDAFENNENLLLSYQERYLYFLIDEFQDTNGTQNKILEQLTNYWDIPNVFAVGDDDQSIFEFQGARVKNILDFYNQYKGNIRLIVLEDNYRSTQSILDSAKYLIDNNEERLIKKLPGLSKTLIASKSERKANNFKPEIHIYENLAQEEAGIIMQVEQLRDEGIPLQEIAILYHRHAQAENLMQLFEKRSIPFQVKKKMNVLETPLVQNLLQLFEYIVAETHKPNSGEHLLFRILHFPYFDIAPHDVASIAAYISNKREYISWRTLLADNKALSQIKLKNPESLLRFEKAMQYWLTESTTLTLPMLFEKMLNESGLLQYIIKQNNRIWLLEVFTTLFDLIKEEASKKPHILISEFLELIERMEIHGLGLPVYKTIMQKNGVQFISTHSAKGMEFDYVFLMGAVKDKWEKAQSGNQNFKLPDTLTLTAAENKTESLRRLFYVAVTRARQHLYVSYSKKTNAEKEQEPSQFILELKSNTDIISTEKEIPESILLEYKISELSEAPKVEIDLFDKEFIARRLNNFVMSASSLNAYLECPVKFYFEKIIRVPQAKNDSMAFGSAVHNALHKLFENMKESSKQIFPNAAEFVLYFELEMARNRDAFTDKQFKNKLEQGKLILPAFYNNYIKTWNKVFVTEYPIRGVEYNGIPITGVFDKIEFDGTDVNVVDYKTGSVERGKEKLKKPNDKNPNGGDYWRQLVFYKILMDAQKLKPWKMVSGEIDFIEIDKKNNVFEKYRLEIADEDIGIVSAQLIDSYNKIMQMEFTVGCDNSDCNYCKFVRDNYIPAKRND